MGGGLGPWERVVLSLRLVPEPAACFLMYDYSQQRAGARSGHPVAVLSSDIMFPRQTLFS